MKKLNGFVRLRDEFIPKRLETFCLLDKRTDDLYELTEDAFAFLLQCDGTQLLQDLQVEKRFLRTLLRNDMLRLSDAPPAKRLFSISTPPLPSLRYLEVQLTERCNINCRHCCQGKKGRRELPWNKLKPVLDAFISLQGLRLILSGGEPLLYSKFTALNRYIRHYPARTVLLTNGMLFDRIDPKELNVDEIQFSLDGMEHGHDFLRGKGSFIKLRDTLDRVRNETAIDISFATMIHRENLKEFRDMKKFVASYGAREWGIDMPVTAGNMENNLELFASADEAIKAMKYRFGASYHATEKDSPYACGAHLMTLSAGGRFLPCGFYPDTVFATVEEGLGMALANRRIHTLKDIRECARCSALEECRGGCRFRAGGLRKKDRIMCRVFDRTA